MCKNADQALDHDNCMRCWTPERNQDGIDLLLYACKSGQLELLSGPIGKFSFCSKSAVTKRKNIILLTGWFAYEIELPQVRLMRYSWVIPVLVYILEDLKYLL